MSSNIMAKINLPSPGTYVVAVSGGVDSVALLHFLASAMPDSSLIVAHFDHGIRQDSSQDRQLVGDMATGLGLPFLYEEGRLGAAATEAQARDSRYAFLRSVVENQQAAAIITAHHAGDAAETAMLHALRGADAAGMVLSEGPGLLRPLLAVAKSELVDYATSHNLQWREDSTNADRRLARNFVRHELLSDPVLSDHMQSHVSQLAKAASRQQASVIAWVQEHATLSGHSCNIPIADLKSLSPAAIRAIYVYTGKMLQPDVQFSKSALDSLVMLTKTSAGNWQKTVSSKLNVHRAYGTISLELTAGKQSVPDSLTLLPGATTQFGSHRFALMPSDNVRGPGIFVGAEPLTIRAPEPGDRMVLAIGTKKIQDIFTDAKVPVRQRSVWPVVTRGSHIIWLPGLATSANISHPPIRDQYLLTHEAL